MEGLLPYRKNPHGNFFYQLAKQTLILKTNHEILDQTRTEKIDAFVQSLDASPEILFELIFLFPELKDRYHMAVAEKQNTAFSYLDFQGLSLNSPALKNYFTLIKNAEGKTFLIFAKELVITPNQYPLLASGLKMISEDGEEQQISLAKINAHALIFKSHAQEQPDLIFLIYIPSLKTALK